MSTPTTDPSGAPGTTEQRPDPAVAPPRPDGSARAALGPRDPRWPSRRIFSTAFTATTAAFLAYVTLKALGGVAGELLLIVLALVIALGLDPLVMFLVVIAGIFALIIPLLVAQVEQLLRAAPALLKELQDRSTTIGRINTRYHIVDNLRAQLSGGHALPLGGVLNIGVAVFGTVTAIVTVLVLTVYFLANLPDIRRVLYRMVPASRRGRTRELGDEISVRVGGYVVGNLLTSVIAGLGTFLFLEIVGVPYPAALGVLVAVLDLIPVVGSTIGGILVTLVALTVSTTIAIASLVFYVAYRLLEDYLLVPRVMNRTVEVPPVLTIVALLIGGSLAGIIGAFLAIPAAAAAQLIITRVVWPRFDAA